MVSPKKKRSKTNGNTQRLVTQYGDPYKPIVENAPEILALIGGTGAILYTSPHTEKLLGYRRDELDGRDIFELIHPEDIPRAAKEYSGTIQQEGENIPSILRFRDSTGEWIPFEIIANNRLNDPEVQAVVFSARDLRFRKEIELAIRHANADTEEEITKRTTELAKINAELRLENQRRRQAERHLQHTVSLLNATLDSTADGILVVSNTRKITSCNQKFAEMWQLGCGTTFGEDDSTLLAKVVDQLQSPNDFLERLQALYADPAATSFDVLQFKDGRIFERYSQPQRIHDKIMGRVWSFRDVTRSRKLEMELRQSQKMEALGRLAGGIAHDFNNLLMLISGYATQLNEIPNLNERQTICEQVLAATRRGASVTKQLLAFCRKQPDAPAVADLNAIVLNMEGMLRRLLSDQIQLQVSVVANPLPVYVDTSQIEMLIMNLAVNAQDAMPEGGKLSITTGEKVRPQNNGDHQASDFAVLEVTDTGCGMTPEVKARIFEPFFTTKQAGRGTGLGLSTVLGIAERSGGYVEVVSEPNQGATFRVYLPQVEASPKLTLVPSDVSPPGGGNETILLAEDESGIRTMTRAYLETLGYRVLEAADGNEAIRRALEYSGPIDLVLTDLLMPGTRGDLAVKAIRNYRPSLKAIFMSGYADQNLEEDADSILNKPFELPELGRKLRFVLDQRSVSQSSQFGPAAD